MLYFDSSYMVRLYTAEPGAAKVRSLARTDHISCCLHGRAEIVAAFHRKFRENAINQKNLEILFNEFERDCNRGAFRWLPLSIAVLEKVTNIYRRLPATIALRAADAVHLACAVEAGCTMIYSNDTRLLESAPHFGLVGANII